MAKVRVVRGAVRLPDAGKVADAGPAKVRPRGRIPAETKAWLAVYERDCGWEIAVCKCGRWFAAMDHLAPYHTETNLCKRCGYKYEQR